MCRILVTVISLIILLISCRKQDSVNACEAKCTTDLEKNIQFAEMSQEMIKIYGTPEKYCRRLCEYTEHTDF